MHAVYLRNTANGHNKHYFVWVSQGWSPIDPKAYCVLAAWGKIDADPAFKIMETHMVYTAARDAVDKLARQKTQRGYATVWASGISVNMPDIKDAWARRVKPKHVPESFPSSNGPIALNTPPLTATGRRQPKARAPLQNVPAPKTKKPKEEPERMIRDDAEWNF